MSLFFSVAERYAEIRDKYPKIGRFVRFENPDGQGPVDNCELMWGSDLFYAFYDEPELVHALLRRVTDTVRRLVEKWQSIVPCGDGYTSYFGQMGRGGIVVRDDSAMNLSPEFFDEFIAPYDGELLTHFGGGIVHFCGRGEHFIGRLAKVKGLTTVDMSQPRLNDMESMLSAIPDNGICFFCPKGEYSAENHAKHRMALY